MNIELFRLCRRQLVKYKNKLSEMDKTIRMLTFFVCIVLFYLSFVMVLTVSLFVSSFCFYFVFVHLFGWLFVLFYDIFVLNTCR